MVGAELFRQGPRPFAVRLVGLSNWVFLGIDSVLFEIMQVNVGHFEVIHYQLQNWLNNLPCSRLHISVANAIIIYF